MKDQVLLERTESITPLIAWLSTCLMAAGLGPLLDTHTHLLWLRGGCFGLVAAAGLEGAVRTRIRREQRRYQRALQNRCERTLQCYEAQRECQADLSTAIAHLLGGQAMPFDDPAGRHVEPPFHCSFPVDIFSVRRESASAYAETDHGLVTGRLANLSVSGFGLELDEPIARQLVVLSLLPPHDQDFDLLAELLWCQRDPDGQIRGGGRLMRVLAKCASAEPDEMSPQPR